MLFEYFEMFRMFVEQLDKFTAFWVLIFSKAVAGTILLPGAPLTLMSGVILGKFWGTVASMIGNMLGAILAFLWARYLFKNFVHSKILNKYPKIREYESKLFTYGFLTVLFLRLVPLFPFNVINPALGVTGVKFKDYFLGSFLGMIPGTFVFVYLGESFKLLSVWNILFAVLGLFSLSFIGKIWRLK